MLQRSIGPVLLLWLLAGCATQSNQPGAVVSGSAMRQVQLRTSNNLDPGSADYDKDTGRCSAGSTLLLTPQQVDTLSDEWNAETPDTGCMGVERGKMPSRADYPEQFARLRASGSADVLVRVEKDGTVESARAVCVTDTAFGKAAEATVMKMRFTPRICAGQPVRGVILLPLSYDWE